MWFTGLKVHVITTFQGQPKEFTISAGSMHDLTALQKMYLGTLPRGSTMCADKAYTSQPFEQKLLASKDIFLAAERKAHSKRGQSVIYSLYGKKSVRKLKRPFSETIN